MLEPDMESSGIRVDFTAVSNTSLVIADPIRLKQVIFNLLSNAIKYNRVHGTVAVKVTAETPQALRISVHDTGQGLPAELLSQLFQPFNRLGKDCGNTKGTGIGLVVSRRLAELMGGSIGVSSVVGVGSVFWVELLVAQKQELACCIGYGLAEQPPPRGKEDDSVGTVLYVEDNHANLDLVAQILADRPNIELLQAHDGREGVAMARKHKPRVILMDIDLPDISGLDALKILQLDPSTRHIPVLAVSANAMQKDIANGLAAGFFRYLSKPFRIWEFLEVLDQALVFAASQADAVQEKTGKAEGHKAFTQ